MTGFLPPVVGVLLGNITDYSAKMDEAKAKAAGTDKEISAAGKASSALFMGVGLAVVGVGVASIKMASDFQTQMTRLYTAAGAPKQAVQDATDKVLQLGSAVGFSGTQMAEALYHPVSAGLDLATSLEVVKFAAQEAQISGASLDDTTYSLSSVMKAFNLDASQAHDTMATLNSIVGQGDMRFQDFNTSIKNWAPTAAQMGISITSMGAALAYLTDRGNSAEEAATRVTMGLTMMATPSKQAAKLLEGMGVASADVTASTDAMTNVLKKTGITQNQLAVDLQSPDGIYVALTHLKTALADAGIQGTEADSVISKIFGGGRSDKAIMSLLQNLDGLKTKFQDISAGTKTFDQAWADTQKNFSFQMKQLGASAENVAIRIGLVLIPMIQGIISWFQRNEWAAKTLGVMIGVVLAGAMVRFAQIATTSVLKAIASVITAMTGMGGAAKASAAETAAAATAADTAARSTGGWASSLGRSLPIIGLVIAAAVMLGEKLGELAGVGDHTAQDTDKITNALLDMSNRMPGAADKVQQMATQLVGMSLAAEKVGKGPVQGMKDFDSALAAMVSSGNAKNAKNDFDQITQSLEKQGVSADQVKAQFPGYIKALEDAATQSKVAASASDQAGGAIGGLPGPLDAATTAANGTSDAIKAVTDAFNTLTGNITASNALDAFKKDLLNTSQTLATNGTSLADNTIKGLDNRDAFSAAAKKILDYRDAQIKNGGATQDANKVAADQAAQLIQVWVKLGANKTQVEAYAKALGLVPGSLYTAVTVDTSGALRNIQDLRNAMTTVSTSQGSSGVRGLPKAYAKGGWVEGAPGAPQLAIVHGGEFVLSDEMLSGRGFGGSSGAELGLSGGLGATSAGSGGGTTTIVNVYPQNVFGTVNDLRDQLMTSFQQHGQRNGTKQTFPNFRH